jgi:pimeloyl-ACP methyl ester carboxylesterase
VAKRTEAVLLLHGLWMNSFAMLYLSRALDDAGFATDALNYHSMRGTLSENVAALAGRVAETAADVVHLVAHSLGGIVALNYLEGAYDRRIGRVVLLGAPVGGSRAARAFADWPGGEWMLGRSIDIWLSDHRPQLDATMCVGAIAGSNPFGLGSVFMDLPGPSDGLVMVEETRLPGMSDHLVLPVSHSGMLMSHEVARQSAVFLRNGRFER